LAGSLPDVYAVKGAIGHALGSAGLASLVIACLCAQVGRRPPMPWLEQPMNRSPLPLEPSSRALLGGGLADPKTTQAVFAAGFGGHVAGAVIRGGGRPGRN
jgi:3-oxoacyl-[acyl-carrier-protein] synthase II